MKGTALGWKALVWRLALGVVVVLAACGGSTTASPLSGAAFYPSDFPSSCQAALDKGCCSEQQACAAVGGCTSVVARINACPPPRQDSCVNACGNTPQAQVDAIGSCTKTISPPLPSACDWPM